MRLPAIPSVNVTPGLVPMAGGLNLTVPELFSKPGSLVFAYNYEPQLNGGYRRMGNAEYFDGHTRPDLAGYVLLTLNAAPSGLALGDSVNGETSGATGKVIYLSGTSVGVTRVTGTFANAENLREGVTVRGVIANATPAVDGFLDNELYALAAADYRADIAAVPGSGEIRGLAVLSDVVYAWRDNVGATAMEIYKSSSSGWVNVPLMEVVSFTAGGTEYTDGETLTQGGVTATIKRVVLESGAWGGTAAGRFIITGRSGGNFAAGASTGGGTATLSGAQTAITLSPGGRVQTVAYTFTAQLSDKRLYGCDGVNAEFEFDGETLVPINTGMGSVRAEAVAAHKNHLMFGYRGSLQHSGTGTPFIWSAVFGAAELSTGDTITNLISVGGSEASAALMVLCENALFVLYGSDDSDWNLVPLSTVSGAKPYSVQDIGGVVALDAPGFVRYPATQSFGNFAWDTISRQIDPIARGQTAACSVFITDRSVFRCVLSDGTGVSGVPVGKGKWEWSTFGYPVAMKHAVHAEIAGQPRTFYGGADGYVYEADVGRSFAGQSVQFAIKLWPVHFNAPFTLKSFRWLDVQAAPESAFALRVSTECIEGTGDSTDTPAVEVEQYGAGLTWDVGNYDEAYWDTGSTARKRLQFSNRGTACAVLLGGESDNELPHVINAVTLGYTALRMVR